MMQHLPRIILKCSFLSTFITIGLTAASQTYTGIFRTTPANTLYHQFIRSGGGAAVYINQTDAVNPILRLSNNTASANVNVVLTVENNGNTGIGTLAPTSKLSVGGGITLFSGLANSVERPAISAGTISGEIRGLGTGSATMDDGFLRLSAGGGTTATNKSFIDLSGYTSPGTLDRYNNIIIGTRGTERLRISSNGNIGIGTKSPASLLSVNGDIQAKSVHVTTTAANWPDYVFEPSYILPTLSELRARIKRQKHLPGVPAAGELEQNGLDVAQILALQQKKIEELTLYLLEEDKQLQSIKTKLKGIKVKKRLLRGKNGSRSERIGNSAANAPESLQHDKDYIESLKANKQRTSLLNL